LLQLRAAWRRLKCLAAGTVAGHDTMS